MQNNIEPLTQKEINLDFAGLVRGQGIDKNEYDIIVSSTRKAYEESKNDTQTISFKTGKGIKQNLGGQWLVFVSEKGKIFDFSLGTLASSDYLTFLLGTLF